MFSRCIANCVRDTLWPYYYLWEEIVAAWESRFANVAYQTLRLFHPPTTSSKAATLIPHAMSYTSLFVSGLRSEHRPPFIGSRRAPDYRAWCDVPETPCRVLKLSPGDPLRSAVDLIPCETRGGRDTQAGIVAGAGCACTFFPPPPLPSSAPRSASHCAAGHHASRSSWSGQFSELPVR
ncbi:hypothetical protein FA95DRAFT_407882 [Auriscalpium vulgare]|uniref:Uncharacterized protein n=1 Tax=Auriscalpium vulgare TaxID=40419 RepID=A0ACB8RI88_9AGAM|nr:hypothetical protein FA95DRAFT_407882 [Auriscalpium vulgare]